MDTTQDILLTRWNELQGRVRQQWGKITEDDLEKVGGKTEELINVLRRRYGYGKMQAEIEINNWLIGLDQRSARTKRNQQHSRRINQTR